MPSASFLTLDGAVLQSNAAATFNRPLGTSGQAFQWTDSHRVGFAGGFAGGGGPLTVNIGGAGTTLNWGVSYASGIMETLDFGSSTAASTVTFQNGINLNGASRTINVDDNPQFHRRLCR